MSRYGTIGGRLPDRDLEEPACEYDPGPDVDAEYEARVERRREAAQEADMAKGARDGSDVSREADDDRA